MQVVCYLKKEFGGDRMSLQLFQLLSNLNLSIYLISCDFKEPINEIFGDFLSMEHSYEQ